MPLPGGFRGYKIMQNATGATSDGTPIVCTNEGDGGYAAVVIQLSGTFDATVTFEGTVDGANWHAVMFENLTTGASATTTIATGLYRATVLALTQVRARISTYASGNVTAVGQKVA